jgi:ubiquitin C-terminal hydrolase
MIRVCLCRLFFHGRRYDCKTRLRNCIKKNYYCIRTAEDNNCPDCDEKMKIRDSRKRTVMDENGEKYIFSLRRFQCNRCKSIHLELPDCIIPNKRYSKDAINMVVSGTCDYYTMDQSTIYRWTHPVCNDKDM